MTETDTERERGTERQTQRGRQADRDREKRDRDRRETERDFRPLSEESQAAKTNHRHLHCRSLDQSMCNQTTAKTKLKRSNASFIIVASRILCRKDQSQMIIIMCIALHIYGLLYICFFLSFFSMVTMVSSVRITRYWANSPIDFVIH